MIYNDMKRYVGAVTGTVIVTITGKNATYTYDGSSHSATSYTVSISNSDYKTSDFTFSGSASVSRTAAGTSYMGLSASQFTNTNAKFKDVRFVVTDGYITINKKAVTVTIKGNNASYTYNGGSRSLSGYTATSDSSLYTASDYTVGGTSSVSGTNAGTYKQALTATNKNSNFNVTFNITQGVLTINKLAVTVSIAGSGTSTYTYDGAAHTIQSYTFSSSSSLYTASLCTISKVSRTVVGTTANAITAVNNSNNFTVTFNITNATLTINKAPASGLGLSVTGYSGEYDGSAHTITATVSVTSGTTIQYSTDNSTWSTTKPTRTAIGTTTVYARAVNSNYETATATATITISTAKFYFFKRGSGIMLPGVNSTNLVVSNEGAVLPVGQKSGSLYSTTSYTIPEKVYSKMVVEYEYVNPSTGTYRCLEVSGRLDNSSGYYFAGGSVDLLDPAPTVVSATLEGPVDYPSSGRQACTSVYWPQLALNQTTTGMQITIRNWWLE